MENGTPENLLFYYDETPEQANEYLRLTLAFLGKYGIAPNPVNFKLGYEYILG